MRVPEVEPVRGRVALHECVAGRLRVERGAEAETRDLHVLPLIALVPGVE
jgi:hypothetical protein